MISDNVYLSIFWEFVGDAIVPESEQRAGQWAFNVLRNFRPMLANNIAGSNYDPFFDDKLLSSFFKHVCIHWNDYDKE